MFIAIGGPQAHVTLSMTGTPFSSAYWASPESLIPRPADFGVRLPAHAFG